MANDLLLPLLETVKDKDGNQLYCCVKRFLIVHQGVKTGKLADAWGLHRNTITNWRRRLKSGELQCPGNKNCRIATGAIIRCSVPSATKKLA